MSGGDLVVHVVSYVIASLVIRLVAWSCALVVHTVVGLGSLVVYRGNAAGVQQRHKRRRLGGYCAYCDSRIGDNTVLYHRDEYDGKR